MSAKLIDLNSVDAENMPKVEPSLWLEVQDLKNSNYTFGFWNVVIRNSQNGQQYLEFKGISKDRTFEILKQFGFAKRYRDDNSYILIQHKNNILTPTTPALMKDFCLELIDELPPEIDVCGFKILKRKLREIFLNEHRALFNEDALSPLNTHTLELISDIKDTFYFPFKNCVVEVSKTGKKCLTYSELKDVCIWQSHIKERNFELTDEPAMYRDFIANVAGQDSQRIEQFRIAIGYLLHRYLTPTSTKAIILYDEQITDSESANGGTGKGIFSSAVGECRELAVINGKRFDTSQRFALQKVNDSSQIVFLDDILPDFDFEYFNSILTDGWEIEQKNKTTIRIPFAKSPKLLISANQIIKQKKGTTASRRQYILEFSDYYSAMLAHTQKPIVDVHGVEFFREWTDSEFNRFYNYMFESCILYLQKDLPIVEPKNVKHNLLLQQTCTDFWEWLESTKFEFDRDYSTHEYFTDFKLLAFGEVSNFGTRTFHKWMQLYAESIGVKYMHRRFNTNYYFRFVSKGENTPINAENSTDEDDGMPF